MSQDDGGAIDDETHMTEITIQPDGRVYVFGTSRQVLGLLNDLRPNDASLQRLLRHTREGEAPAEPRFSQETRLGRSLALPITDGGLASAT